jgi:hypothetical protein
MGWWARGVEWQHVDSPSSVVATQKIASVGDSSGVPSVIHRDAVQQRESRGSRNLFAYREAPAPIERIAYIAPPSVAVVRESAPPPVVVEAKPRLRFASRYIGRFGPDRNPIAAFARDGQIVTVRIGDRVDEHFVLRRIGIESVDVEAQDEGEIVTQQVPLG